MNICYPVASKNKENALLDIFTFEELVTYKK